MTNARRSIEANKANKQKQPQPNEKLVSQEADAKTVLRFPENRKLDSVDAAWVMIKNFVRDDVEWYHILWTLIFSKGVCCTE